MVQHDSNHGNDIYSAASPDCGIYLQSLYQYILNQITVLWFDCYYRLQWLFLFSVFENGMAEVTLIRNMVRMYINKLIYIYKCNRMRFTCILLHVICSPLLESYYFLLEGWCNICIKETCAGIKIHQLLVRYLLEMCVLNARVKQVDVTRMLLQTYTLFYYWNVTSVK